MKGITKFLMALMVLGIIIGGSIQCMASESATAPTTETGSFAVTMCSPLPEFMMSEVHQQNYLRYLVKQYDPAELSKWEKAFTARKAASKQMHESISVSYSSVTANDVPGIITVTLPDNKAFSCKSSQNTVSTSASANQVFVSAASDCRALGITEAAAPDPLYKDFEKAVELGDDKAVTAVLPKILDKYTQVTEDMLKDVKK